ncbi:hypothetical protein OUZ56_027954 [Daphnia magna]|uniref:Uncharacterized protein n=1 Tax=Daphnia magna TaxID=35525 RepID=A0ABR0B2E6_9CRUS|nr:hypothetical protein OUZ56_027954 [Daphnia magna]
MLHRPWFHTQDTHLENDEKRIEKSLLVCLPVLFLSGSTKVGGQLLEQLQETSLKDLFGCVGTFLLQGAMGIETQKKKKVKRKEFRFKKEVFISQDQHLNPLLI